MPAELPGEVALVGESGRRGNLRERLVGAADARRRPLEAEAPQPRGRRFRVSALEFTDKMRWMDAGNARELGERRRAPEVGSQKLDDALQPGRRGAAAIAPRAGGAGQQIQAPCLDRHRRQVVGRRQFGYQPSPQGLHSFRSELMDFREQPPARPEQVVRPRIRLHDQDMRALYTKMIAVGVAGRLGMNDPRPVDQGASSDHGIPFAG